MKHRSLPKFLGLGAAKAGTSSLHDLLDQHPQIFVPTAKELDYFGHGPRGNADLESYEKCFAGAGPRVAGELTPSYLYNPRAPGEVMHTLGPETLFLVVLRHPVDRAYSHYQHMRARGVETLSFLDAIAAEPARICRSNTDRNRFSYVDRGRYYTQLARWMRLFPRENFHVLLFEEDIVRNMASTMVGVFGFLGVADHQVVKPMHSNEGYGPASFALNRMLFVHSQMFRPIYRALLPNKLLRRKLRDRLAARGAGPVKRLDAVLRSELFQEFFLEGTGRLEELIGEGLSSWRIG